MFKRCIEEEDLSQLLSNGTIIEEYKDDFPFPSVLINGVTGKNRPLHAVIGIDSGSHRLFLITIYEPDPEKWSENYNKRVTPWNVQSAGMAIRSKAISQSFLRGNNPQSCLKMFLLKFAKTVVRNIYPKKPTGNYYTKPRKRLTEA
jgi:Domain of unknown function (DUF4258)